jgi:oxygen-independent coproporphyrinogen-3 oxidase
VDGGATRAPVPARTSWSTSASRSASDRCGFCLFPSEVYRGPAQLVTYLRYLRREGELYRGWFDNDEGPGGLLRGRDGELFAPEQYRELMDIVRAACPLAPAADVTVEGSPSSSRRRSSSGCARPA